MDVFRAYRIACYCTVLGSTTMYGVAEPNPQAALLAVLLAITAWVVTGGGDIKRARRAVVPRWVVNCAVVLATALMALAWINDAGWTLTGDMENTVSRFSQYLLWLQLLKLFEACRPRDQAQLIALSTMLVVGACLTSITLAVGVVLVIYLPVLAWTVVLFQIYAAGERVHGGSRRVVLRPGALRGLRRVVVGYGIVAVVIGACVFMAMPRGFGEKMLGAAPQPQTDYETGFSDTVQLGSAGLISESRRIVGDVQVHHGTLIDNIWRYNIVGARRHLLRGAVLDEYDREKQMWVRSAAQRNTDKPKSGHMADFIDGPMKIDVMLRQIPTRYLFTILAPDRRIRFGEFTRYNFNPGTRMFERRDSPGSVSYTVSFTEPAANDEPWPSGLGEAIAPFGAGVIREEALGVIEELEIDLDSDDPELRHRVASALTSHLGRTCAYTLEMHSPDAGQDPIDMFLERREGHCEYFASALAAMCMSVGIHARVVTGFSTDEYDEGRQRTIIRENHAHAWVEAEVYPGVWRSFDPSPTDAVVAARTPEAGIMRLARRMREMIEYVWIEAVVSYGETSRSDPQRALHSGMLGWIEKHVAQPQIGERRYVGENTMFTLARRALVGVIAGLIAGVVSAALLLLLREPITRGWAWWRWALWARLAGMFSGRARAATVRHEHAYRRVLNLLARAGLAKPHWRPALAHAREIEREHGDVGRSVRGVVELYYAERFGGVGTSDEDSARVDSWVQDVTAFVKAHRGGRKGDIDRVG